MARGRKVHRYRVSTAIIIVSLAASTVVLYLASAQTKAFVGKTSANVDRMIQQADAEIKATKERRVAEAAAAEALRYKKSATAAAESARLAGEGNYSGASLINPKDCNSASRHTDPAAADVIVNKRHCMQPLNFEPSDLVAIEGGMLRQVAISDFNAMKAAAAAAGQPFRVTSGYRSYINQVNTFNHWVSISGMAGADTYSARPGYSEHQTGLVVDVAAGGCVLDCFGLTSQYKWLEENAANYGFIQRYYAGKEAITGYSAEEWHYRYVGIATAKDMKARGINTLEEYWGLPGGDYETLK